MTAHPGILVSHDEGLTRVTLDRPDRLNTIDLTMAESLLAVALDCSHDTSTRAVLLEGNGRSLCGGGDLKSFAAQGDRLPRHLGDVTFHLHAALSIFARLPVPLVVAAQGGVAGAGLGLLCVADLVIAAEDAKFVFAYNAIGLSPDGGTSWLLPRLVGQRRAIELALNNRTLTATEALDFGLVNRVVPPAALSLAATSLAMTLADGPTEAFRVTKRLFREGWNRTYEEQMVSESEQLSASAATHDGKEGIAAFLDRRVPVFRGH